MRASSYQNLIDGLDRIDAPDEVKRQFEELLRRNAALDGVTLLERRDRVRFSRELLDLGEDRALVCVRLQALYGIGRSQAYKDIAKALQIVRKTSREMDGHGIK